MASAVTPGMAAAVVAAGGFAMLPAAGDPSEKLRADLQSVRSALNIPLGQPIPVGVGFMGFVLDKTEVSEDSRIPAVLSEMPSAIWLAFGDDYSKYVKQIREHDAKGSHRTKVFVMVNNVNEAVRAANEWQVDAIVAQGSEAGGHGGAKGTQLRVLFQGIKQALPNGPLIIAAGGITSGAEIAGLLLLGADGVVIGTRLLFTPECQYTDVMKEILLKAGNDATERSTAFDDVRHAAFWPKKYDGRAISNEIMTDVNNGLSLEDRVMNYSSSLQNGKTDRMVIWAGNGVGLVNQIQGTEDVIKQLHADAVAALENACRLVTK